MTVEIHVDAVLLQRAQRATDIHDPTELVHWLLQRAIDDADAQERLANPGGTISDLVARPENQHGGG